MNPLTPEQQAERDECIRLSVETAKNTRFYRGSTYGMYRPLEIMACQMGELNFLYKHPELLISEEEAMKGARG